MSEVTDGLVTSLQSCKSISRIAEQLAANDMMDLSVTDETPLSFNYSILDAHSIEAKVRRITYPFDLATVF